MPYDLDDTIAAIATAPGGGYRGMIRASGPATCAIVRKCFTQRANPLCELPHHATVVAGELEAELDGAGARRLPCDLFLWPTERSYTRQVVAEFHTLGSPPLLQAALEGICRAGGRLAEPGEFTLRSFLAGRLDLTQAEAVLGVANADQPDELRTALEQLAGGLARPMHQLRDELLGLLAELEAGLDFVEEDIEFISAADMVRRLEAAAANIRRIAAQMTSRVSSNSLPQVTLIGPPNVGKSSLFNALVAMCGNTSASTSAVVAALVSTERGTTRDYLVAAIDLAGLRCELVDTAGVASESTELSSQIAVSSQAKTRERSRQAVLRALCVDASTTDSGDLLTPMWPPSHLAPPAEVIVLTKADLIPDLAPARSLLSPEIPIVVTSSVTRHGLDELRDVLKRMLNRDDARSNAGCVAATADRCRDSLRLAEAAVNCAADTAAADGGDELVAAELRTALTEIGKVVGTVYTDDLLDRIFKTFCIGK